MAQLEPDAARLRAQWGMKEKITADDQLALFLCCPDKQIRLELRKLDEPKLGAVWVDFVSGAAAHRRKFGGGKGQTIAKAAGIKGKFRPHIIDATAGLGRDAFVFASLGCRVSLIERCQPVAALLEDGLKRALMDPEIGEFVREKMTFVRADGITELSQQSADVVYLDPMFPHKKKKAQVKKEMRVFQHLVGADEDADLLLAPALAAAKYRVIVKRPDYAPWLNGQKPTLEYKTKSNRFDVYVKQAMPTGDDLS